MSGYCMFWSIWNILVGGLNVIMWSRLKHWWRWVNLGIALLGYWSVWNCFHHLK